MLNDVKRFLRNDRAKFHSFCSSNELQLSYDVNSSEVGVLRNVFQDREYADYFPFYRDVTIVDIGAHYGYFSIFASKNSGFNSKVFSFEPNKVNFEANQINIRDCKLQNVSITNCAIGGVSGLTKLYEGLNPNHSIFENYKLLRKNTTYTEVQVKTLEEVVIENRLTKIDFLKIDCEGAEYAILENAPDYVFDLIETISMEFHDMKDVRYTGDVLVELLTKKGFQIMKFKYDKTTMNLNYGKIIGTKRLGKLDS
jgi:FkbM family methyltransferase